MAKHQFDLCVIGAGPGGYVAAIRAQQLGLATCVIEEKHYGGICLNWGCIPTKALLKSAEVFLLASTRAAAYGVKVSGVEADMKAIVKRSRDIADQLNKGIQFLLKKHKVTSFDGRGRIAAKGLIEVTDRDGKVIETIAAKQTIIATGARPRRFDSMPLDHKRILDSSSAMILTDQPDRVIIIGAGAIGVEFGYYFASFGAEVTILEMMDRIVPVEDKDCSRELAKAFKKQGIKVMPSTKVESVKNTGKGVEVAIERKGKKEVLKADYALVAVGIQGNIEELGLEKLGVKTDRSFIQVDGYARTNVPDVYAIGDVAGPPWLAHKASHEGLICVEKLAGHDVPEFDKRVIPGCTYCQPQIASVGLTEAQAKEAGHDVKIGKFAFKSLGKALAVGDTDGFVKLVFDKKYGELLGAHIVHGEATELISELVLGLDVEATMQTLIRAVHPHPTLSEAIMEAAAVAGDECVHL